MWLGFDAYTPMIRTQNNIAMKDDLTLATVYRFMGFLFYFVTCVITVRLPLFGDSINKP